MQAYIEEKQQAADDIVLQNPGVMKEYKDRQKKISELEEQAASVQERVDLHHATIADRRVRPVVSCSAGRSNHALAE